MTRRSLLGALLSVLPVLGSSRTPRNPCALILEFGYARPIKVYVYDGRVKGEDGGNGAIVGTYELFRYQIAPDLAKFLAHNFGENYQPMTTVLVRPNWFHRSSGSSCSEVEVLQLELRRLGCRSLHFARCPNPERTLGVRLG
jgi:hypothetical protein